MALQFGSSVWKAVKDGVTTFSASYFNPIWELIDKRLVDLEDRQIDWVAETEKLAEFGLQRVDTVLTPAFTTIQQAAEFGFLVAPSSTLATLAVNVEVSLYIDPTRKNLFAPTPYVEVARTGSAGASSYAQVISYTRETGELRIKPAVVYGDVAVENDWIVSAAAAIWTRVGTQIAAIFQAASDTQAAAILIANGPVSTVAGYGGVVSAAQIKSALALTAGDVGAYTTSAVDNLFNTLKGGVTSAHDTLKEIEDDLATRAVAATMTTALGLKADATTMTTALAGKEPLWAPPATMTGATNAADRGHYIGASANTLTAPTPAAGIRFRAEQRGTGSMFVDGNGKSFRGTAGPFEIDIKGWAGEFYYRPLPLDYWDWS